MEHIAIIGLGCLFPEADSLEKYWNNLYQQKIATTPLSSDETWVDPSVYYHPTASTPDTIHYHCNGHIRNFHFDATGYALPANELNTLDALFKWTIHAAAQALNDSGYRNQPQILQKTGLLIGNIAMPTHSCKRLMSPFYHELLTPYVQQLTNRPDFNFQSVWPEENLSPLNLITAGHNATIAAQALALQGPCYALDAACSSAFYAIKMASDYLLTGKADMMLAGAVCHADHIYLNHGFNILQAFPNNGASIPFDRHSKGLQISEGAGIIALKRYADAIRDNDKIYGVIESIGLSNDAGAKHMLVPDINGQLLALKRAYQHIPADIDYLECHATGTFVGDQVELAAIESFFASKLPLLGANKANHGHMLTASGMASLLKVILAMQHNLLPATLKVQQLTPTPANKLDLQHLVRFPQPWPISNRPKRAGINAFGFGGVNAHLVLSEDHPQLRQASHQSDHCFIPVPLALVGIGVHLADTEEVAKLDNTLQQATQHLSPLPATRWLGVEQRHDILAKYGLKQPPLGAYIEKFEFDCKRFRLPPNVVGPHLITQLFLLPIAEKAFLNAGYSLDGKPRNIAVIVAGAVDYSYLRYQARNEISWQLAASLQSQGIELTDNQRQLLQNIIKESLFPTPYPEGIIGGVGNIAASRIAAHLHLNGPVFSLYSEESAAFKAFELAQFMLTNQQVDAVIVASCCFSGGPEHMVLAQQLQQVAQAAGDGGCAVVLQRETDAKQQATPIYATLEGLAIHHAAHNTLAFNIDEKAILTAAKQALAAAACSAEQIDYIELLAGTRPKELAHEIAALAPLYTQHCAPFIGTSKAYYGDLSSVNGLLAIIKCALQLNQRYLPALPHYTQYEELATYAKGHFRLAHHTQAWPQAGKKLRRAAINYLGIDRAYSHMILREPQNSITVPLTNRAVLTDKELKITLYTAREKKLADLIINKETQALFSQQTKPESTIHCQPHPAINTFNQQVHNAQLKHLVRNAQTQLHYLRLEHSYYQLLNRALQTPHIPAAAAPLFNQQQLLELTDGLVANVLGAQYAAIDSYAIRTRMPSPPYLFVSRITTLSASKGKLEPCYIEWQYDIPDDAWYLLDGNVPLFVVLESSHALIVAFTVIGCDHLFQGALHYRAIDSQTTVYSDMPKAGETLRGRVDITSFVNAGGAILITYQYSCFVGERLVSKLQGNSGFFSQYDIAKAKSLDTSAHLTAITPPCGSFTPLLHCTQQSFAQQHIDALIAGDMAACFGPQYAYQGAKKLCTPAARMLSRVLKIDLSGGAFGLGEAIGEVDIYPEHWVFDAHFKNDPVMPGSLLVEGCEQLMKFFLYYLGLNSQSQLIFQPLFNHQSSAKFRAEVKRERDILRYHLTCKSIDAQYQQDAKTLATISLCFFVEIIYRGNVIGFCDNLGVGFSHCQSLPDSTLAPLLTLGC